MAPDIAPLSAQTSLFAGLGFLAVFITWIRNRRELALVPLCLGLLALCASGLVAWLGFPVLLTPLLLTVGLLLLHWGTSQPRPGLVLSSLLVLVLVSHFLILFITEPGYVPRESSSFLVWTGLSLVTATSLVSREESSFISRRLPLFVLFVLHALFCLSITSAYQLGIFGSGLEDQSVLPFLRQTELSLFCVGLVGAVLWVRLQERVRRLEESLRTQRPLSALLPVCSSCRSVREQDESWSGMEFYLHKHLALNFTHGICPDCAEALYPGVSTTAVAPRAVKRRVSHHPFSPSSLETVQKSPELAPVE